jgi:hypothetical protein
LGSVILKQSLKHSMTTSIIGSVQPELGQKVSMMTIIIGLRPTLIRYKTNLWRLKHWSQLNIKWAKFNLWRQVIWGFLAQQNMGWIHLMTKRFVTKHCATSDFGPTCMYLMHLSITNLYASLNSWRREIRSHH